MTASPSAPVPDLGDVSELRLVAVDLDGTLLDDAKRTGPGLDRVVAALEERGVVLVAASGRQYATLHRELDRPGLVYIAENGAWVLKDGRQLSIDGLDPAVARRAIARARARVRAGADAGHVLCGTAAAYVERHDDRFLDQVRPYYASLELVDDLDTVQDEILKVAVYDFAGSAGSEPDFAELRDRATVVVSGPNWLDVGSPTANKGTALRRVQQSLGIGPDQTMAFGDYLNDLGMLGAARWSVAMSNAHPQVRAAAAHIAPSNNDNGVVRTLARALGLDLG
jgi:hypothetical protein